MNYYLLSFILHLMLLLQFCWCLKIMHMINEEDRKILIVVIFSITAELLLAMPIYLVKDQIIYYLAKWIIWYFAKIYCNGERTNLNTQIPTPNFLWYKSGIKIGKCNFNYKQLMSILVFLTSANKAHNTPIYLFFNLFISIDDDKIMGPIDECYVAVFI